MDINLNQIAQLIAIAEQANIDELEISEDHRNIRITCRSSGCGHRHHKHTHASHHHHHKHHHESEHDEHSSLTPPVLFSKSVKPAGDLPLAQTHQQTQADASQVNAANPQPTTEQDKQTASAGHEITSPMVGTFYRKSSPDAPAFVDVGKSVAIGDTLCIIEAMKIMHEVKAEQAGVVREILVNDGDMVEYAQPILIIE